MVKHQNTLVFVPSKRVLSSPKVINAYYKLPNIFNYEYSTLRDTTLDYDIVKDTLCRPDTNWEGRTNFHERI